MELLIDIERVEQLVNLFGNLDENIKRLESKYNVAITSHSGQLKLIGETINVTKASRAIKCLLEIINKGETLTAQNIDYVIFCIFKKFHMILYPIPLRVSMISVYPISESFDLKRLIFTVKAFSLIYSSLFHKSVIISSLETILSLLFKSKLNIIISFLVNVISCFSFLIIPLLISNIKSL